MAKPKALAIPKRLTAVGPDPMPPTTAAPQPKNTKAKVPTNSAICLFIPFPPIARAKDGARPYSDGSYPGKGLGAPTCANAHSRVIHPRGVAFVRPAAI